MFGNLPKISVRIICYKQEELIKRAINSLLAQRDYIYEICVSDDCSPDNTWKVLLEYENNYPGLFKLHRNEQNLGIFENVEYSWTMPTGEIIYGLAGDDECGDGWFKSVVDFIQEKHIDYKNELFCIYGDYKAIYPNGDYYIASNRQVVKDNLALSLALRHVIGNRGCCYSKKVLDKFQKVSQGRSYIAEEAIDRQLQIFSDTNYYIPCVGNVYYANIGVCVNEIDSHYEERLDMIPYALSFFDKNNVHLSKNDVKYLESFRAYMVASKSHKILDKLHAIWLNLQSFDMRIGLIGFRPKRYLFALLRRIPHRRKLGIRI